MRDDIGALAVSMKDTERETLAGTNLAQQTGVSLDEIFGVVEQQALEIAIINQAARQQSQSSNTVVQIMQEVSASTLQNTSSTHTVEQNMERLARLAQQMQASVGAFKLRQTKTTGSIGGRNGERTLQNGNGQWRSPDSRPLPNLAEAPQFTGSGRVANVNTPIQGNVAFTPYPLASQPQRRDDGQRFYSAPLPNPNTTAK